MSASAGIFQADAHRELSDDATGVQVSLFHGELSLTVPYWYNGPDAQRLVALMRRVVLAIEEATGLTAYDPQADAPSSGAEMRRGWDFDRVHDALVSRTDTASPP